MDGPRDESLPLLVSTDSDENFSSVLGSSQKSRSSVKNAEPLIKEWRSKQKASLCTHTNSGCTHTLSSVCSTGWSFSLTKDIIHLEKVQRRAAWMSKGISRFLVHKQLVLLSFCVEPPCSPAPLIKKLIYYYLKEKIAYYCSKVEGCELEKGKVSALNINWF